MKISFVCFLFESRPGLPEWTQVYSPEWVDKLYRGVDRNTSGEIDFVCLTDKEYEFKEPVRGEILWKPNEGFGCLAEAWRPGLVEEGTRIVVLGLDTIIVGDIEEIITTDLSSGIGLLRDPYAPDQIGNMVGIYDHGVSGALWKRWQQTQGLNDQNFLRRNVGIPGSTLLNDRFPGQILSYKVDMRSPQFGSREGEKQNVRIVYFHGRPKPNEVVDGCPWLAENWR